MIGQWPHAASPAAAPAAAAAAAAAAPQRWSEQQAVHGLAAGRVHAPGQPQHQLVSRDPYAPPLPHSLAHQLQRGVGAGHALAKHLQQGTGWVRNATSSQAEHPRHCCVCSCQAQPVPGCKERGRGPRLAKRGAWKDSAACTGWLSMVPSRLACCGTDPMHVLEHRMWQSRSHDAGEVLRNCYICSAMLALAICQGFIAPLSPQGHCRF
jgi:hypothetical protein